MRNASFIAPASVVVATIVSLVACTVAPAIPDGLDRQDAVTTKPKKDAGTTATKDGSTSTPPTTPPGEPTPTPTPTPQQGTGACAPTTTQQACFDCCEAANPNALPILDLEWDKCACAPAKCQAACGTTYCASPRVPGAQGDACDLCLGGADAECLVQMKNACLANPACKPLYTCDDDALCLSKP